MTEAILRRSARVIVVDDEGRTLLFRAEDPAGITPPCWITPGGGLEEGEDDLTAACRELYEETGRRIRPSDLIGPVGVSEGPWKFRGVNLYSVDVHYALRTSCFPVEPAQVDPVEAEVIVGHRWWSPGDLEQCTDDVFPRDLTPLIRDIYAGVSFHEPRRLPW